MKLNLVKVFSSKVVDGGKRIVKLLRYGRSDVRTANQIAPPGIDSAPIENLIALYAETGKKGQKVVVGYISKKSIAESGELRLYSQNDNGDEQTYVYLKKDGTIELGGSSDNAVRYSELKTAFDELKNDFNTFVSNYNLHTHVASSFGAPTTPPTPTGSPSIADMSASKIDELKTP